MENSARIKRQEMKWRVLPGGLWHNSPLADDRVVLAADAIEADHEALSELRESRRIAMGLPPSDDPPWPTEIQGIKIVEVE